MIRRSRIDVVSIARVGCLCLLVNLFSGCLEKRIQWSPDGTRAAVITADGLFLADPQGELVPISSAATVYALTWLSDSQQMVVAARTVNDEPCLGVGRIAGTQLVLGDCLYSGDGVVDIRVAADDRTFAFTVEAESVEWLELFAAPMDGSLPPTLVSTRVAAYPDWSADGQSLVYIEAANNVSWEEDLRLGSLQEQRLISKGGEFGLSEPPTSLARLVFATYARVRCLADGRLIFNAGEFELPYAAPDAGGRQQQLFLAAPNQHPTLVRLIPRSQRHRLPESLSFFEVSPDETEILFATTAGGVFHLTLATGNVQVIQTASAAEMKVATVWRAPGEYTYVTISEPEAANLRQAAVVLRRGRESRVLSDEWPGEVLDALMAD